MTVPFFGKEFTLTQPDGSTLKVRGWGDQYHAMFRTLDGDPVVENPETGFYEYAHVDQAGTLKPGGVRAGAQHKNMTPLAAKEIPPQQAKSMILSNPGLVDTPTRWRVRSERKRRITGDEPPGLASAPPKRHTIGTFVGLCLLIEFPDVPSTISQAEVDAFLNRPGYSGFGNNGSVRDYFLEVSGNKVDYSSVVVPYYRAKHPRSYYTDERIQQPLRAYELINEALAHLKKTGFNFSQLTVDDEQYIYAINVYYAGPCMNNWAKGLWPHSYHLRYPVELASGVKAFDYQFTNMGDELTLGTFCHENGHMICDFPDLYDYGYESAGAGMYCLMCAGANASPKNPVRVSAYLRYRAGWFDTVKVIDGSSDESLEPTDDRCYIYQRNRQEYFIIEQRHNKGRDQALPGSGLAVWHVDEVGDNSNEQGTAKKHYECALVQADGNFDLEHNKNPGDDGDLFPGKSINNHLTDSTTPNSRWWNGQSSRLSISNITHNGAGIQFKIG